MSSIYLSNEILLSAFFKSMVDDDCSKIKFTIEIGFFKKFLKANNEC